MSNSPNVTIACSGDWQTEAHNHTSLMYKENQGENITDLNLICVDD